MEQHTRPVATTHHRTTADGLRLTTRDWMPPPDAPRRGAALIVHGLGEHSGRYTQVAAVLTELGIAVRAYDQRGFGASEGPRAAIPGPDALLDDARMMYEGWSAEAREAGDSGPPLLIGHSMGGTVAARAATGGWITPGGLVLVSPALRSRMSHTERVLVALGSRLAPDYAVPHGLPLDRLSHDPQVVADLRCDPLAHDRITPRLARFIEEAGAAARRDAPTLHVPTLLLVAGDDRLVDPSGAREFADAMPPGRATLHWYPDSYHELLNERGPERSRALTDLREWITARLAARAAASGRAADDLDHAAAVVQPPP